MLTLYFILVLTPEGVKEDRPLLVTLKVFSQTNWDQDDLLNNEMLPANVSTVIHHSASSLFAHGAACSRQRRFSNKLILKVAKYLSLEFEYSYAMANGAFGRHHSASTSKLGAFGPINVEEL